jgi:translation elongation factor EF-1alpha
MDYIKVGKVTHFFDKINVAAIGITDDVIRIGDKIRIGEFGIGVEQKIDSMQMEHQEISEAKAGDEVGIKVMTAVKSGDIVYKISE